MNALVKERRWVLAFVEGENLWREIGDPIMGGLSYGDMTIADGVGIFSGVVSLDRGGGFASVRSAEGHYDLSDHSGLVLRVQGDGKRYGLRLRTSAAFDGINYQADFQPTADTWQDVELPFTSFQPVFRGKQVAGIPSLDPSAIRSFGLIIASRQAGPFRLEIESVNCA
jgi:NADH dehydrogenase [ubiquinone] 1 alpha subcomplex assembly factor 1